MKKILVVLAVAMLTVACGGTGEKKTNETTTKTAVAETKVTKDIIQVLNFHGQNRCITCKAIEKLTGEVVTELASKNIKLSIINVSDKANEEIADKYQATWTSLQLDYNGKVVDLTKMAFANAKNKPEEFKKNLKEAIENIKK